MLRGLFDKGIYRGKIISLLTKELKSCIQYSKMNGTEIQIMSLSHALEKGMGIKNVKHGYGVEKANLILNLLQQTHNCISPYTYAEAYTVLQAYIRYQKNEDVDISQLEKGMKELDIPIVELQAGYQYYSKQELMQGTLCNYKVLVESKHSVRLFGNEVIDREEIERAIGLAARSPSACNRQPYRVYYTLDTGKNSKLATLVPGNKSFETDIPYYCVVAVDRASFAANEIFQWYLNGGIFISYFTLALHSLGIGSCIFQYPDFYETLDNIRSLIGMKDSEVVAAIVGFGKYPESTKCIGAARKPVCEISKVF